jgi:carboxylesterase type B
MRVFSIRYLAFNSGRFWAVYSTRIQRAALEWVQIYISKFGGDPK